jgi:hypothetical protein
MMRQHSSSVASVRKADDAQHSSSVASVRKADEEAAQL